MRHAAVLIACIAVVLAATARAEPALLDQIAARLEQPAVVRAAFEQTRTLAAFKHPLVTHGRFVFSRAHGVLWSVETPIQRTYLLTGERMATVDPDGTLTDGDRAPQPAVAQIARIFRALLGADLPTLQQHFDIKAQGAVERWRIELRPRDPALARHLGRIELSGTAFVERIRIDEPGGDATTIEFRRPQADDRLTPDELRSIAPP